MAKTRGGHTPILLGGKRMHIFVWNPFVRFLGSISTISVTNSPKTFCLTICKTKRRLLTCAPQTIFHGLLQHIVELEPETHEKMHLFTFLPNWM